MYTTSKRSIHNPVNCLYLQGIVDVNCYLYSNTDGHSFLIDPGCDGNQILDYIKRKGLTVDKILLTHGHFDHFGAASYVSSETGAEIYAYEKSKQYLPDPEYNLSTAFGTKMVLDDFVPLRDGDVLYLNDGKSCGLTLISTPGHTEDSVIYYSEENGLAFTGDTVFRHSYGNTSFPGGNLDRIRRSILEIILKLPEDTLLYSGHTPVTDVKEEKGFYKFIFH